MIILSSLIFLAGFFHSSVADANWSANDTLRLVQQCSQDSKDKQKLIANHFLDDLVRDTVNKHDPLTVRFVCGLSDTLDDINAETQKHRSFMMNYLRRKAKRLSLSKAAHLNMTYLLIRYRLIRHPKTSKQGFTAKGGYKSLFIAATRYDWVREMENKMRDAAKHFVLTFGIPNFCHYIELKGAHSIVRKGSLTSTACMNAIHKRVSYNPKSLVISQSIIESATGTSEWTQKYNNILGLQILFNNPSSMGRYANCSPSRSGKRCILNFPFIEGSLHEYLYRFNASPNAGYEMYRNHRQDVCDRLYTLTGKSNCEEALADVRESACSVTGSKLAQEFCRAEAECGLSIGLSNFISHYAENPHYTSEVRSQINKKVCNIIPLCRAL